MFDEFEKRGVYAIAVAQEDTDLESHGRFLRHFGDDGPRFTIVADVNREKTADYKRTSTYLIDSNGIVRQIFPGLIRFRGSWNAVLGEIDRIQAGEEPVGQE